MQSVPLNAKEEIVLLHETTPPNLQQTMDPDISKEQPPTIVVSVSLHVPEKKVGFVGSPEKPRASIFENLKEIREERENDLNRRSMIPSSQKTPSKSPEKEVDVFKINEEIKPPKYYYFDKILNGMIFQILVNLFTIYALFGADVKFLICDKTGDPIFDALTLVSLGIFSFEVVFSCLTKKDYFLSFFFYLDLVSTLTLVLDLTYVDTALL